MTQKFPPALHEFLPALPVSTLYGRGRALAAPSTSLVTAFGGLTKGDGPLGADVRGMTRRGPGRPAQPPGGGCDDNDS